MPADISVMVGIHPVQFTCNLLPSHRQPPPDDVMCLPSFNGVQGLSLTNLKSCLRNTHQHSDALSDSEVRAFPENLCTDVNFNVTHAQKSPKKEKRVTFADAQGEPLASVKYMVESSSEPPSNLSSNDLLIDYMTDLTLSGVNPADSSTKAKLCLQFSQPVSDFVTFRQKLDEGNVSLENVLVKNSNCISGTVKVKNIAYHKKVAVRISFDDWTSFIDVNCEYVNNAHENGPYDTFQFSIAVPIPFSDNPNLIQFCVFFDCNSQRFWDNNKGKNYSIAPAISKRSSQPIAKPPVQRKSPKPMYPSTYSELPKPEQHSWSHNGYKLPFY